MRIRAGGILIEDNKLALIERHRGNRHYFSFPGGGVDRGETFEEAVIREIEEELGLQVKIIRKIAQVTFNGKLQHYFLVEKIGGEFGSGSGEEYGAYNPVYGTYLPLWMPIIELQSHNVLPRQLASLVSRSFHESWPAETVIISE
jgi:8-oxo-dGTP pyrophosphatase MutT (NUDIX family)